MIGKTISHYKILEKLGEGGMGVVYKAQDTKLDRIVALKFLPKHLLCDNEAKTRFELEAKAASALDHSNIATIHEIDEVEGECFICMAYVEGKSIKELLKEKTLSLKEVLDISIQIAEGLNAAHKKGIVHRDIKSDNLMLTKEGLVKIMDFGLAKLKGVSRVTKAGTTLGTVCYMSPEQARGEEVDHRTDIWSLGVVLYEMVTGQLPFKGEYEQAVIYAILNENPKLLIDSQAGLPSEIEPIVNKALSKSPDSRYQKVEDIVIDLRKFKNKLESVKEQPSTKELQPSIAILPFTNLSADKENEYFSDGLAEDIIDALTQVPGLRVMARTSAFAFRGKEQDVREIGARLGVEHILEGSVRRAGNHLRVTAQLVKASDGYHLWSQRFDREMTDVFAIQDEISHAIVEKLRHRLAGDRPLVRQHTKNMDAYHLFLRGRYCIFRATPESVTKGKEYLEQAIALDPNYALAYASIAEFYVISTFWGFMDSKEALPKLKWAAMEALSRDDTLAEAHSMLGVGLGISDFDWVGAERELSRALELNPASPIVRYYHAMYFLRPMGLLDEASSQLRRAMELDPLSPLYNAIMAYLSYARGQYDLAIVQQRFAMDLDPSSYFPHWLLAVEYEHIGRFDEAIAEAQKACELSGRNAPTLGILGLAYGLAGRSSEARVILEELTSKRRTTYVPPFAIAAVYRGLGEMDQGLEWLEKGVEERDVTVVSGLKSEPRYFPFHGHPRFQALLRKMNLES
jgi:serine/threonine protein kinase/Flp pilus assembly protein TadD